MTNDKSNEKWWIALAIMISANILAALVLQINYERKRDTLTPEVLAGINGSLLIDTEEMAVKTTLTPKIYTFLGTNWIIFKK